MKIIQRINDFDFKRFIKKAGKYALFFHIIFITFIALVSFLYIFFNPPFTTLQAYRFVFNGYSSKKHYNLPIKAISRKYQRLVVSTEDPNFYRHYGIDPGAIATAIQVNLKYGKKLLKKHQDLLQKLVLVVQFHDLIHTNNYMFSGDFLLFWDVRHLTKLHILVHSQ